jgi:hypothetical protein
MARYKVLKSIAHNFAHSFVSLMNCWDDDYVMCHLLRAVKPRKHIVLRLDVLKMAWSPTHIVTEPLARSMMSYCQDFGRFVTNGGAALDMVSRAKLRLDVRMGQAIGFYARDSLNARVEASVIIRDDRGQLHSGAVTEYWGCGGVS